MYAAFKNEEILHIYYSQTSIYYGSNSLFLYKIQWQMDRNKEYRNSKTPAQNPYAGILFGLLLVLLLNGLFFPNIGKNRIIDTDYVSFIEKVDKGMVRDVVIKDNQIYFTADDNGETAAYKTGETNDPDWWRGC